MLQDKDFIADDIAGGFDTSKPGISHHLDVLKQADLIRDECNGPFIHYSINTTLLEEAANGLSEMIHKDNDT